MTEQQSVRLIFDHVCLPLHVSYTVPERLWVKFHVYWCVVCGVWCVLTALKFCGATLFMKLYQEPMGSWLYMVV